jgi:hypothetical protein
VGTVARPVKRRSSAGPQETANAGEPFDRGRREEIVRSVGWFAGALIAGEVQESTWAGSLRTL